MGAGVELTFTEVLAWTSALVAFEFSPLLVLALVRAPLLEAGALEILALEAVGIAAGPRETGVEADGVPVVTAVSASAACAVPRASSLPLAPRSATPSRKLTSKPKVFVFIVVCLLPDTAPDPLTFREETMCNWLAKSLVSSRSPAAEASPPGQPSIDRNAAAELPFEARTPPPETLREGRRACHLSRRSALDPSGFCPDRRRTAPRQRRTGVR